MKSSCFFIAGSLLFAGCAGSLPPPGVWEYTGGPFAQNVSTLLVDRQFPTALYAGLTNGQIFSSTDDGASWFFVATIRPGSVIRSIVQNPDNPATFFAATSDGAFASEDGASTWRVVSLFPAGLPPVGVRVIAFDPWKPNILYAGSEGQGILKSTDGGSRWNYPDSGADGQLAKSDVSDIAVDPSRPDYVYCVAAGLGILRSTNAGEAWSRLTPEVTATSVMPTRIKVHPRMSDVLVYATDAGGIYRSINGGRFWSPSKTNAQGDRITSLAGDPVNQERLYAGSAFGVLSSTDFGSSWTVVHGAFPRLTCSVAAPPAGTSSLLFAYGEGIGVQRSSDEGVTWAHADAWLGGSTVTEIGTRPGDGRAFACVGNMILTYDPESRSWAPSSADLPGNRISSIAYDYDSPSMIYTTTTAGAFRSGDGGLTWESATRGLRVSPDFIADHPWIHTRMFLSGEEGLFVSTDKGTSWIQTIPLGGHLHVRTLTFMPTNAGVIYGAIGSGVIATGDGGFHWETVRYGIASNDIESITLDDRDPRLLYAWTMNGGCYRSTNRGIEWNRYAPPWKPSDTVLIAYDRKLPSSVVALVNSSELYYSSSGGGTWFPVPSKPLDAEPLCMSWHAATSMLYVGTLDKGAYRVSLAKVLAGRR